MQRLPQHLEATGPLSWEPALCGTGCCLLRSHPCRSMQSSPSTCPCSSQLPPARTLCVSYTRAPAGWLQGTLLLAHLRHRQRNGRHLGLRDGRYRALRLEFFDDLVEVDRIFLLADDDQDEDDEA